MDLHRAAIFVKVVDERGFTAAARALDLPKSSVSRAVALLEQELGARLLRRSTRSVALTEAGAAFYERASRGLAALSEAREAVVDLEATLRGPIRVTTAVDAGVWLLAPVVGAFVAQHPDVLVDVVLTGRVVDLGEEGIDLALRAGPIRDDTLVARRLPRVDFALVASRAYLDANGTPKRVAELAQHRCVLFRGVRGRATWTLTGPRGEESVEVRGVVNADDFSFAHQAVAAGAGIGLLPAFDGITGADVVRVLPRYGAPGAPFHLVYPSARYVPRRVAVFRDFLLETLSARR
ncbi:LysR family transcriptional regulator [Sandaracinus amylolyticus]|uniref:Transcriptional regulator, LysR family protein n=1 Tax=Sandaracinus amylolyticus TaxID=927083 RepID=A0A0F6YM15_9BACT|nr:LysR family transcriptional regulator [Sandaracinus amylolyticus]AKF08926.1 Transcriptional regulator, LysR family protein [Sandaracinus amylolyticus]